jgi:4'-phosphopantetheinyl transferase
VRVAKVNDDGSSTSASFANPVATPATLIPGVVHVWSLGVDLPQTRLDLFATWLSSHELDRARRFHFERDRRRFIAAHGLLRGVLGGCTGRPPGTVHFDVSALGRPEVDGPLQFSLSHSSDLAVVAVTIGCAVGVDVERLRPMPDATSLARQFSGNEQAMLSSGSQESRERNFFRLWTCKEAYAKAIGRGLDLPLNQFTVSFVDAVRSSVRTEGAEVNLEWSLQSFEPAAAYIAAVAVQGERVRLSIETAVGG